MVTNVNSTCPVALGFTQGRGLVHCVGGGGGGGGGNITGSQVLNSSSTVVILAPISHKVVLSNYRTSTDSQGRVTATRCDAYKEQTYPHAQRYGNPTLSPATLDTPRTPANVSIGSPRFPFLVIESTHERAIQLWVFCRSSLDLFNCRNTTESESSSTV